LDWRYVCCPAGGDRGVVLLLVTGGVLLLLIELQKNSVPTTS